MKITIIAGARPNFIKIAPIIKAIEKQQSEGKNISYRLVHTGQHYDKNLSATFFEELNIPHPNANLEVKSGSQAEQTAAIMIAFEKELHQEYRKKGFPVKELVTYGGTTIVGFPTTPEICTLGMGDKLVTAKEAIKAAIAYGVNLSTSLTIDNTTSFKEFIKSINGCTF